MRPERKLIPPANDPQKGLARLDVPALIHYAEQAMRDGAPGEAAKYLRTAVRKAPLRQDLREMLSAATEAEIERAKRAQQMAPQVLPRSNRRPLIEDDPRQHPDEEPAAIQEIRMDPPVERDEELELTRRMPRVPAGAPPQAQTKARRAPASRETQEAFRSRYQERHRRGPMSATIVAMGVTALLITGAASAVVWYYYERASATAASSASASPSTTSGLRPDRDRELMQKARDYENQNQFALAMEQLQMLSESPEKKKQIAEAYARQGDYFTFHNRYNEARNAYQLALENDPASSLYAHDLGSTLYLLGRHQQSIDPNAAMAKYEEAEKHLQRALELNPSYPQAIYRLGKLYAARGDSPSAAQYYRRLIQQFGDSKEAKEARADLEQMGLKP